MGYVREGRKAYGYVKFPDRAKGIPFTNINHYYAPQFYLYLGRDWVYKGIN